MTDHIFDTLTKWPRRLRDMGDGTFAEVVAIGQPTDLSVDAIGQPDDPAWDGQSGSASLIAIMKACHARLAEISANTGT